MASKVWNDSLITLIAIKYKWTACIVLPSAKIFDLVDKYIYIYI